MTANGVSLDAALTTMMLARIYEQLLAIERALQVPGDEWRNE